MSRLLVHIGYHKTATNWLQRELFGRPDCGFHALRFPPVDGTPAVKRGSSAFTNTHPLRFDADAVRRDLRARLDAAPDGCHVISNERLSGYPDAGGCTGVRLGGMAGPG